MKLEYVLSASEYFRKILDNVEMQKMAEIIQNKEKNQDGKVGLFN